MDHVPRLENFLKNQQYTFAGVDIRGDRRVLGLEKLYTPPANHVDIQDMYWKKGLGGPKAGMATMAAKLIDPKFGDMKKQFKEDKKNRVGHKYWECKPLSMLNMEYAAMDGYITYELYNLISQMSGMGDFE